ncbi:hypothetical protein HispidOSU_003915 [Sigmodon hispidus]
MHPKTEDRNLGGGQERTEIQGLPERGTSERKETRARVPWGIQVDGRPEIGPCGEPAREQRSPVGSSVRVEPPEEQRQRDVGASEDSRVPGSGRFQRKRRGAEQGHPELHRTVAQLLQLQSSVRLRAALTSTLKRKYARDRSRFRQL